MDRNHLLLGLTIWLLALGLFAGLGLGVHTTWTLERTGNRDDQCEKLQPDSTVVEPQNTWSNSAYLLAGILILLRSRKPLGLALGAHLCILAVFSGFYHASLQGVPQTLDVAGIYFVLLAMILYGGESALTRLRGFHATWPVEVTAIVLTPVVGYLMATYRRDVCLFDSTTAVILFAIVIFALCVRQLFTVRFSFADNPALWIYLPVGLPAAFLSFLFRLTDGDGKPLCYQGGMLEILQAHAVWHVLSAATLLILYDFFAWISGEDYRIFGYEFAEMVKAPYPRLWMGLLAGVAGVIFVLDGLIEGKIVIPNPEHCHLWGFVVGIPLLIIGALTMLGIIEP